jgi:purine nucleosidase
MPTKIILDTDIGDDVDDALALALICASPEVELLGVTTVFGNVQARARQAQTILQLAAAENPSFGKIPVAAGCSATLASRKNQSIAADAKHVPAQAVVSWNQERLPAIDPRHGIDFLIQTIMAGRGDIVPVTIGAITNLAMALVKEPAIATKIPRIVSMAGEFRTPMAEWNIKCDPEAASIVFSSGLPMDIIPWHIGRTARLVETQTAQFATSNVPMARYLGEAVGAWRAGKTDVEPALFDPMAIALLIEPALFEWKQGQVRVELRGEDTYGYTTFKEGPGPHRIAWNVDRDRAVHWYLQRVLRQ